MESAGNENNSASNQLNLSGKNIISPVSGLSGNEIYCLENQGFKLGNIAVGNSVYALGLVNSIGAGFKGLMGGEITQVTKFVSDGRKQAIEKLEKEIQKAGGIGIAGVSSEIITTGDRLEFLSVGSVLHADNKQSEIFSSSADGQELYCQIDAGYNPKKFVFGNVAYSIGVGRGIIGSVRTLKRGEIPEYTDIFTTTRNLALQRIIEEAKTVGANSVTGIRTKILPFGNSYNTQEMIMVGTASINKNLPDQYTAQPASSDLINQELWSLTQHEYIPMKLMLATSVYSLGIIGGLTSFFKSFKRGEIPELTNLVYEAREKVINKIQKEASELGAESVVGTNIYLYDLGSGLIEILAIGTAVKKIKGVTTISTSLLSQAIIKDKDTFIDQSYTAGINLGGKINASASSTRKKVGVFSGLVMIIYIIVYLISIFRHN